MSTLTALTKSLAQIKQTVARPSRAYEAGRSRHAALAPYGTPAALLGALGSTAPHLDVVARNAVVGALVTVNQSTPDPIWQSLLLAGFERMLLRLRARLGSGRNEDLDQRVLAAFLEAIRSVRADSYVCLAIRRATAGAAFASRRAEREAPKMSPFVDDRYLGDAFGVGAHASVAAAEVVRIVEAHGDDELLEVLLATRATDESLTAYVAREYAGRPEAERSAAYYRLRTARTRVVEEIRARLAPRDRTSAA